MIRGLLSETRVHGVRGDEDLVRVAAVDRGVPVAVVSAAAGVVVSAAPGVVVSAAAGVATDLTQRRWPRCWRRCSRR